LKSRRRIAYAEIYVAIRQGNRKYNSCIPRIWVKQSSITRRLATNLGVGENR
jgi:hypothetical protein